MYKVALKITGLIILIVSLVACSSAKNEVTSIHDDVTSNVKESIIQIRNDMKKHEEIVLANPDISAEEYEEYSESYAVYLEGDMNDLLHSSREYLQTYKDPHTDEGKAVLDAYINTYEAYFELLEKNGRFLIDLLADDLTEDDFDHFDKQLEAIDARINNEVDELNELFEEYSKQYSIIFVDPLY